MVRLATVVFLALLCSPAVSLAQPRSDEAAIQYNTEIQRGHDAARRADWQAAADAYGEAAALRPRSAEPVLYQAMLKRSQGDLAAALPKLRDAARLAEAAGDAEDGLRAKALLAIAMVLEAQRQLPEARTAFQQYVTFAESHGAVATFPAVGRSRIQAIDRVDELDQAYREVRERIAERERENRRGGSH